MKRPQTKFHADTMSNSKAIRSKKSKFISKSKFIVMSKFLAAQFFIFIDILFMLQQQILTRICNFVSNSDDLRRNNVVFLTPGRSKVH